MTNCRDAAFQSFACHAIADRRRGIRASFLIRSPRRSVAQAGYSSFVICRSVLLIIIAQMCCSTLAQAQTPNMTGTWNVEFTFTNAHHRSVRFEAQSDGKGTLQLQDPRSKVWGTDKASEAKWTRVEGNSITFSGPVEFLLRN